MNENNITNNNQEEKDAIYRSKFLMTKDLFYDFCFVSYNRIKKIFLIFLSLSALSIGVNLLSGNYDTVVGYGTFIPFLMILIYFRNKKSIKINYERNLISEGKESALCYELFEDKIVSHVDELKREYFYFQITSFFETKNFILLHLQHNLHITIEKNNLNASVDEVKAFLMNKCTLVKKKRFVNCSNDQKWSLAFLIALIIVSVISLVAVLVLKQSV